VILTDVVPLWPALTKWTFAFFAKRFGDVEIVVSTRFFGPGETRRLKFKEFMDYCLGAPIADPPADSTPLYCALQPFRQTSPLMSDFCWPDALENLYGSFEGAARDWYLQNSGLLLIGPKGTVTPLHVDRFNTHAWLAQLQGTKHCLFFSPEEIAAAMQGRVNPTWPDGPAEEHGVNATLHIDEIANVRDCVAHEAVLEPGDLLVFPRGWYHRVIALEPSISMSFNFVGTTNFAAHMLEIIRDLPRWSRRLNTPALRAQLGITWKPSDFL
jgi:hypothetical protein